MDILHSSKTCPICGEHLGRIIHHNIAGTSICGDCEEKIDLPKELRENITLEELQDYMAYYEANRPLAREFKESFYHTYSLLGGKTLACDELHGLIRQGINNKRLIFPDNVVTSFRISEDDNVIFEADSTGFRRYDSRVPEAIESFSDMIKDHKEKVAKAEADIEQAMKDGLNTQTMGVPLFQGYEPFEKLRIVISLDTPYWKELTFEENGPLFDSINPSKDQYMEEYQKVYARAEEAADALFKSCFPGLAF